MQYQCHTRNIRRLVEGASYGGLWILTLSLMHSCLGCVGSEKDFQCEVGADFSLN